MSAESIQNFMALSLGFAFAGMLASGYQLLTARPLSFRLMAAKAQSVALASVPLLIFAAPFLILRNTIRGRRIEGRPVTFVALATVIAGFWSLMSGTLVAAAARELMRLAG